MHKKMIKIIRMYHITNLENSLLEPNISAYKHNSFYLHTPKCASHLDIQSSSLFSDPIVNKCGPDEGIAYFRR